MFLMVFWKKYARKLDSFSSLIAHFLLTFYRIFLSGTLGLGGSCRFYPSCSEYATLVYKNHSFLKASVFVFKRLTACHPFGPKMRLEPELDNLYQADLKIKKTAKLKQIK